MAFKFTVDYQNLRLVIDTDSVESVSVFQHLKSTVDYQDLRQILAYQTQKVLVLQIQIHLP